MAGVNGTRLNDAKIKQSNEIMATATEEVEILRELRREGYLVAVPPGDNDDAYVIALARGEGDRSRSSYSRDRDDRLTRDDDDDDDVNARAMSDNVAMEEDGMTTTTLTRSHLPMGVYVVSNNMFHDAIRQDENRHGTNDCRHVPLPLNCRSSSHCRSSSLRGGCRGDAFRFPLRQYWHVVPRRQTESIGLRAEFEER